ncbi:MAG: ABC transporter ATP-binding protein [Ktedonobacterales bacterium]
MSANNSPENEQAVRDFSLISSVRWHFNAEGASPSDQHDQTESGRAPRAPTTRHVSPSSPARVGGLRGAPASKGAALDAGADPAGAVPALAFERIRFGYREHPVVRDVSFTVAAGELVGLLGPNGAGKSTLLKLATGALQSQAGRVTLGGQDVRRLARSEIARRVAVVPQDFSVQFAYTVRQVVEMGRTPHLGAWGVTRQQDRDAVDAALVTVDCLEFADRIFNELSGGERQRVILALALAQEPDVLLLDEPTAHLDIRHQIETLALLRRLNERRGLTALATLHDLNLAARFFPRLILFDGAIVADGSPASVLESELLSRVYKTPVQVGILRGAEHLSVLPPGYGANGTQATVETDSQGKIAAHVIAGGGSGEVMMRALADARLPFTAGPLNIGDSDYTLAMRLAVLCLAEAAFAPISPAVLTEAQAVMVAAQTIIICPTPLGPGNIALLDAALDACRAGTPALLLAPEYIPEDIDDGAGETVRFAAIQARDYSGRGEATYHELLAAGAHWVRMPAEAVAYIQTHLMQVTQGKGGESS